MTTKFSNFKDHKEFKKWLKENLIIKDEFDGIVYKLYSQEGKERVAINRVGGTDKNGILYIGKSKDKDPYYRVALLCRSFNNRPPKDKLWLHGAEEIYWQCEALQNKYPLKNLFVEIIPCEDCDASEIEQIRNYYLKFGEVPPFNGAIVKLKPK